jgi:hypothetical protein
METKEGEERVRLGMDEECEAVGGKRKDQVLTLCNGISGELGSEERSDLLLRWAVAMDDDDVGRGFEEARTSNWRAT